MPPSVDNNTEDNSKYSEYIREQVQNRIKKGIEIWQVNFKITRTGVKLANYFKTTNDFLDGGAAFHK